MWKRFEVWMAIICILAATLVASAGASGLPASTRPPGPTAPPGGQLSLYGDGSSGALLINTATDWVSSPPNVSGALQFSSVTVSAGWTVPSGTLLSVSGDVLIQAAITVATNPFKYSFQSQLQYPSFPTLGRCSVSPPTAANRILDGTGGVSVGAVVGRLILRPGANAGSWGAGSESTRSSVNVTNQGGAGGGGFTILAGGTVTITSTGSISANGGNGAASSVTAISGGGGSGGIIIIAAGTSVTNSGAIDAAGGAGGDGESLNASGGGGGGGGIVHLISPTITPGTVNVAGGPPGAFSIGGYGGGGGACGGNGGSVAANGAPSPGSNGLSFTSQISEPAILFLQN